MITATNKTRAVITRLGTLVAGAAAVWILAAAPRAPGAANAFDSAADPVYDPSPDKASGWLQLSNGGYGFGPWMNVSGNPDPTSPAGNIGSSTTNGGGDLDDDGDINTPRNASGRAWGLNSLAAFVQNGQVIDPPGGGVTRMFQGRLTVGQTFSFDFDNGTIANPLLNGTHYSGQAELSIGSGSTSLDFVARADTPDYLFDGMDTGVPLTTEGVHCEFTFLQPRQVGAPPYPWEFKITPLSPGGQTHVLSGMWTTDIRLLPDEFAFGVRGTGADPANAVYINNIEITPEPGSLGPSLVGAALLLRRRRRAAARRNAARRVESSTARCVGQETGGGNDERADEADGSKTRNDAPACETSHPGFFAVRQHIGLPVTVWAWVCRGGELANLPVAKGNAGAVVTAEGGLPLLKVYVTTVCSTQPVGGDGR